MKSSTTKVFQEGYELFILIESVIIFISVEVICKKITDIRFPNMGNIRYHSYKFTKTEPDSSIKYISKGSPVHAQFSNSYTRFL